MASHDFRIPMNSSQIIKMLLSVSSQLQAEEAILEFEAYVDRRSLQEGLNPNRVGRGIASRVTAEVPKSSILKFLNSAQDRLVKQGKAVGAARFDGTYVKTEKKRKNSSKDIPSSGHLGLMK